MIKLNKKKIEPEQVKSLCKKFGIEPLEASIFLRRGITSGEDIMYFLENNKRFLHPPFLFNAMEDAVDRINDAISEDEKILIFGDKDVDGISSTAILYKYLKNRNAKVTYRLPIGEDAYGLSMNAVDDFAKDDGSLIITVDCGISNVEEIKHANDLGLEVIVTDHHNPPEKLPDALIIIDPKMPSCGCNFLDISGAAVAFKLVSALRFSKSQFYGQEFTLMNISTFEKGYKIECLKIKNLVKTSYFCKIIKNYPISVAETELPEFLKGQQIIVWNIKAIKKYITELFGKNVEFQMADIYPEAVKIIPEAAGKTLFQIKEKSRFAKYLEDSNKEIECFYNLFITFIEKKLEQSFPSYADEIEHDLQLTAVAALADIMPMKNENRIFVKNGLASINTNKKCKGLAELIAGMKLTEKPITSSVLSWKIIPALNAAGRMGQADISLRLLISEDPAERAMLSDKVISLNEQRKKLVSEGEFYTSKQAKEKLAELNNNLCIVFDERINRGVTGILASKIMQKYKVPSIAVTLSDGGKVAYGSMRSCRGCIATSFLNRFGDIFINHGGHNFAAGFSFKIEYLNEFMQKAKDFSKSLLLEKDADSAEIDAELPAEYVKPGLLKLVNKFEPFGEENKSLLFYSKSLKVYDAQITGKGERKHLKIVFDCGKYKFPAIFWGEADRLNTDFEIGDNLNVLYNISSNAYNGSITPQMVILDICKID